MHTSILLTIDHYVGGMYIHKIYVQCLLEGWIPWRMLEGSGKQINTPNINLQAVLINMYGT